MTCIYLLVFWSVRRNMNVCTSQAHRPARRNPDSSTASPVQRPSPSAASWRDTTEHTQVGDKILVWTVDVIWIHHLNWARSMLPLHCHHRIFSICYISVEAANQAHLISRLKEMTYCIKKKGNICYCVCVVFIHSRMMVNYSRLHCHCCCCS